MTDKNTHTATKLNDADLDTVTGAGAGIDFGFLNEIGRQLGPKGASKVDASFNSTTSGGNTVSQKKIVIQR